MAFSSSSSLSRNHHAIRSISLPTRSHPSTLQAEEELTNLRRWETAVPCIPDAETVCSGVASLERLYTCVDSLFSLPLTRQALSQHQHEKLVDELLDRSMRHLDVCGSVRDVVSQVKEHVRDVQSALRRRKGDFIIDASFLKKLKKDAKRGVADLKQIDHLYASKPMNLEPHLCSVIRVMRDVSEVSISIFGLLLSYLSLSICKPKSTTKWSIVSKFIQKGTAGSKDQPQICVEALECNIEAIENGLECMFRRLIRTRASLLNILSH
ncbi:uncharacterized protein LOC112513649 [Cynara cardunculus var. scolymus]|uniref:uncharacterized protein LOC112513649 n=1 Tax=Cynara cardunculus var. scolymus TaxID=59895 RepID=UPI000D62353C|nr:uncharacterized protein LOC112513649 [Cynara cardunculus var. scolymus]